MKCYRKNGSDFGAAASQRTGEGPSMKCYRKNGSDLRLRQVAPHVAVALNEVLPKER